MPYTRAALILEKQTMTEKGEEGEGSEEAEVEKMAEDALLQTQALPLVDHQHPANKSLVFYCQAPAW